MRHQAQDPARALHTRHRRAAPYAMVLFQGTPGAVFGLMPQTQHLHCPASGLQCLQHTLLLLHPQCWRCLLRQGSPTANRSLARSLQMDTSLPPFCSFHSSFSSQDYTDYRTAASYDRETWSRLADPLGSPSSQPSRYLQVQSSQHHVRPLAGNATLLYSFINVSYTPCCLAFVVSLLPRLRPHPAALPSLEPAPGHAALAAHCRA